MPAPTKEVTLLTSIQTISIVVGGLAVSADSWSAARPAARSFWNHYLYRRHRVAARQRWVRQSRCSEIWVARSFPVHGAGTRPKRDSHCSCDQVGARICNGLGIMRACLETQKLEQLEARMAEIADRVGRDRTNAARERTSTHETQRLSN